MLTSFQLIRSRYFSSRYDNWIDHTNLYNVVHAGNSYQFCLILDAYIRQYNIYRSSYCHISMPINSAIRIQAFICQHSQVQLGTGCESHSPVTSQLNVSDKTCLVNINPSIQLMMTWLLRVVLVTRGTTELIPEFGCPQSMATKPTQQIVTGWKLAVFNQCLQQAYSVITQQQADW